MAQYLKIEAKSVSVFPYEDGSVSLTLDGETRVMLTREQANAVLRGLLKIATIRIESDEVE